MADDIGVYDYAGTQKTIATYDDATRHYQLMYPWAKPSKFLTGTTAAITGTSDTTVIAAQGSGIVIYLTDVIAVNSSATATIVEIKDGTTVIARICAPASSANGFAHRFAIPLKLTANTALKAACLTNSTNTYVTVSGFAGV